VLSSFGVQPSVARRCKVISRSMLSCGPRQLRSSASLVLGRLVLNARLCSAARHSLVLCLSSARPLGVCS
jgi:hypothetical protein